MFHLLKHVNKTTKYYLYTKDIVDTYSNMECSPTKAHPDGLFDQLYFSYRSENPVKNFRLNE